MWNAFSVGSPPRPDLCFLTLSQSVRPPSVFVPLVLGATRWMAQQVASGDRTTRDVPLKQLDSICVSFSVSAKEKERFGMVNTSQTCKYKAGAKAFGDVWRSLLDFIDWLRCALKNSNYLMHSQIPLVWNAFFFWWQAFPQYPFQWNATKKSRITKERKS